MTSLAVIIVSYNTKDLLRDCLRSIFSSNLDTHLPGSSKLPGRLALTVIVVDNASHDGSADMVRAEFPQATLLQPGENLGFTKANNLALHTLTQSTNHTNQPFSPPQPRHPTPARYLGPHGRFHGIHAHLPGPVARICATATAAFSTGPSASPPWPR